MMTKSMVNFSFCRAISSIKSVRTAGAGAPYLSQENAGFFFSRQMTTNKVIVRKIDEDECQMDDDEKINRVFFT